MGVGFLFHVREVHVRKLEGNDAFFIFKKNSKPCFVSCFKDRISINGLDVIFTMF